MFLDARIQTPSNFLPLMKTQYYMWVKTPTTTVVAGFLIDQCSLPYQVLHTALYTGWAKVVFLCLFLKFTNCYVKKWEEKPPQKTLIQANSNNLPKVDSICLEKYLKKSEYLAPVIKNDNVNDDVWMMY